MIDNLLAYGFENESDSPNVASALSEISGIVKSFKASSNEYLEMTKELQTILKTVKTKEQDFYTKLNVSDYLQLNQRIQEIEAKYDALLPDGAVIRDIKEKFDFTKISGATNEEIADAITEVVGDYLSDEAQTNKQFFNSMLGTALDGSKNGVEALHNYLQQNLRTTKGKRFVTSRNLKGGNKVKVGLGRIISKYDPKTNKIQVDIEEISGVSSGFKKKLEDDLLQIYLQKEGQKENNKINVYDLTKEIYRRYVNSIIYSYIGLTPNLVQEHYDLNRSIASTIGYLGEIRATLMLNELAPGLSTRATGNLRTAIKGREIPIDVVCAANGFQIKNYTLDNNTATFSNSMLVPNWINDRLKITGTLAEVLIALFGTYQYNQPLTKGNPPDLDVYKNEVYSMFDEIFEELKPIFDSRIPQVLKIVDEFSVQGDPMFHSNRLYFNTFFWVNRYLVPASWILEQLIQQLGPANSLDKMIQSSYSFRKKTSGKDRFQTTGYNFQSKGESPGTLYGMASRVKVDYNVSIDLSYFANLIF